MFNIKNQMVKCPKCNSEEIVSLKGTTVYKRGNKYSTNMYAVREENQRIKCNSCEYIGDLKGEKKEFKEEKNTDPRERFKNKEVVS